MSMSDLTPPYAIEIVNYQINDDVDAEAFEAICRTVGEEFSSQQPGFIRREFGRSDEGIWLIAVAWQTADNARNSISSIDTVPDVVKTYMSMINRDTLKRWIFDIL